MTRVLNVIGFAFLCYTVQAGKTPSDYANEFWRWVDVAPSVNTYFQQRSFEEIDNDYDDAFAVIDSKGTTELNKEYWYLYDWKGGLVGLDPDRQKAFEQAVVAEEVNEFVEQYKNDKDWKTLEYQAAHIKGNPRSSSLWTNLFDPKTGTNNYWLTKWKQMVKVGVNPGDELPTQLINRLRWRAKALYEVGEQVKVKVNAPGVPLNIQGTILTICHVHFSIGDEWNVPAYIYTAGSRCEKDINDYPVAADNGIEFEESDFVPLEKKRDLKSVSKTQSSKRPSVSALWNKTEQDLVEHKYRQDGWIDTNGKEYELWWSLALFMERRVSSGEQGNIRAQVTKIVREMEDEISRLAGLSQRGQQMTVDYIKDAWNAKSQPKDNIDEATWKAIQRIVPRQEERIRALKTQILEQATYDLHTAREVFKNLASKHKYPVMHPENENATKTPEFYHQIWKQVTLKCKKNQKQNLLANHDRPATTETMEPAKKRLRKFVDEEVPSNDNAVLQALEDADVNQNNQHASSSSSSSLEEMTLQKDWNEKHKPSAATVAMTKASNLSPPGYGNGMAMGKGGKGKFHGIEQLEKSQKEAQDRFEIWSNLEDSVEKSPDMRSMSRKNSFNSLEGYLVNPQLGVMTEKPQEPIVMQTNEPEDEPEDEKKSSSSSELDSDV